MRESNVTVNAETDSKHRDARRIAKNSAFLYLLTFGNYILGLLLYPYLSRVLSVDTFGLFNFSMAFATVFQVTVEFGYTISGTAAISKHRRNLDEISVVLTDVFYARLFLSVISGLGFSIVALTISSVHNHLLFNLLFLINAFLTASLPDFYFRGIERMKSIAIRSLAVRLISYAGVIVFVHEDSDIILIPIFFIVGNAAALVIAYSMVMKDGIRLGSFHAKSVMHSITLSLIHI